MSTSHPPSPPPVVPHNPPARVIPKFSSFAFKPPAPALAPLPTSVVADPEEEKNKGKERHHERKRRHRSRSRSRHHSSRDHGQDRDRDRRRKRESSTYRGRKHGTEDSQRSHRSRSSPSSKEPISNSLLSRRAQTPMGTNEDPPKPWFFDTRGDENNLVYGTIYRYSIPTYRRFGCGRILGLPVRIVIDREKDDGKGLVLRTLGHGGGDGLRPDKYAYARSEKRGVKRLRVQEDEATKGFSEVLDFVPLSKPKSFQSKGDEIDGEWRGPGLIGLAEVSSSVDHEYFEAVSESESDVEYVGSMEWGDRHRMVEFIRRVDADPTNVYAWLEYVDQQDTAIGTGNRKQNAAERTSIAEVKLDILTKALTKIPGNELLILKFMDVAQEIWDSHKLLFKWQQILNGNPSIIALWTRYLNFRQTDLISFTYPECIKCFSDCLDILRTAAFKTAPGSAPRRELEKIFVYVLFRLILLMRESGYRELSTAVLQAMLELNLFCPAHATSPSSRNEHQDIITQLEAFWDSEVPRIGENNAQGWRAFFAAGETGDPPDAVDTAFEVPPLDPRNPFDSWVEVELRRLNKPSMPARTTDDVEEDDPFRVVLFSDLKPFMFRLSCPESIDELLEAVLVAHGLPLLKLRTSNDPWTNDPFLWNNHPATAPEVLNDWFWPKKDRRWDTCALVWEGMEPEQKRGTGENPFTFRVNNFPAAEEALFGKSGQWFDSLTRLIVPRKEMLSFIRHALQLIVQQTSNEALAIYYLAWEWANSPDSVKKVARSLLQKFKTSLRLWTAYAQIEWHESSQAAGSNIFNLALNMSTDFSEESRRAVVYLWHAWIWEELFAGNLAAARRLVLSIANHRALLADPVSSSSNVPKSQYLASRQHLHEQQLRYITKHPAIAAVYNDLYALLQYLCTPAPSLAALTDIYTSFASSLSSSPALQEITYLRHIRLLHFHITTTKPYQPSVFRTALECALAIFPRNTAFLSLYFSNESRTKIENRMRATLSRNNAVSSPLSALFAIWAELHMSEHWNQHAVRRLFESACGESNAKHSVLLWRMWMEFEMRVKAPENAKMVLWRVMRECPWHKDVVVMGLKLLRRVLTMEEKWKCVAIIAHEKELRVHDATELEDAWEELRMTVGLQARMGVVLPDDEESDDEMGG